MLEPTAESTIKVIDQSHRKFFPSFSAIQLESWVGFLSSFSEAFIMALMPFLAPTIGLLLFKNTSQTESVFFSYGLIFLSSFLMCPLGAWYYGRIGDEQGRRSACISSSFGLAMVTGIMAILPIESVGSYAWILFLSFLSLQFFFSAGEYYSSIVFSLEHGDREVQGLMSGLSCFFAVLGLLFADALSIFVINFPEIISWRFPFFIGLLTGLLSFGFKYYCRESPFFNFTNQGKKNISWSFIKENILTIIKIVFVLGLFYNIYSYIFLFLPLIYEKESNANAEWETFVCLLIYCIALLLAGFLADKFKIKRTMQLGLIILSLVLLFFIPYFNSLPFFTRILLTVSACIYIGPIHSWTIDQSPSDKRCRITAISIALAGALFSNSCVVFCLFIYQLSSSLWASTVYILILTIIAMSILLFSKGEYKN